LRTIAKIVLMGSDGQVLDGMAFDADGHAATVTQHPWLLQTFAEQRTADDDQRMSRTDRLTHLINLTRLASSVSCRLRWLRRPTVKVDEPSQSTLAKK
jgi:hypothetical protein